MSTSGMKMNKKRKLEDISNTKPAVAKSLKTKLVETQAQVEVPNHKQSSTAAKKNNKSFNNDSTMIDTTAKKPQQQKRDKSTLKAQKNERSDSKDAQNDDDSFELNQTKTPGKKTHKQIHNNRDQDDNNEQISLTQTQVIIGDENNGLFSLYALAEKQPTKIKAVIDQIFTHKENSEEFVVKTMFLYFMELMGISDITTLQYNANYVAKNADEKKLLLLFNNQNDKLDVSFEKLIFFSQDKKSLDQKKLLKKICKIYVANVVDLLPDKVSYLSAVVQRVCVYSKTTQRLVRYSFTYVGLYLYKYLLGQQNELLKLKKNYEDNHKNELKLKQVDEAKKTLKRVESIKNAIKMIDTNLDTILQHIILKRQLDTTPMIRKSVFEFLLQLDDKELQVAFGSEKSQDLFKMVFGALTDEDSSIRKIALNMVYSIITKVNSNLNDNDGTQDLIVQHLEKHKLDIFKLAIPTEKYQDTSIIVKGLQTIQKMIQMNPEIYNLNHKQMLANLVHYKNTQVREEIGDLLLTISDEFDNDNDSLMQLQKIIVNKGVPEGFSLNFNDNPGKSRKQILKLIRLFEKHVQTRSQYLTQNKKDEDSDEIIVPNMIQEDIKEIMQCDCEERAVLLFQTFMRKTSVLYDVQSLVSLLKRDDIEEDTKVVLSKLIDISLTYVLAIKNQKDQGNNLVYSKIWENQTAFLKLTVMNELLQTFRVQSRILEPLLRSLLILSRCIEKDNQADINDELGKDFSNLLLRIIEETDIDTDKQMQSLQIVNICILNLSQLQVYFPLMRKEIQTLGLNFCDELQQQVIPKLFNNSAVNSQQINTSKPFSFLQKFNVLMTQLSITKISDQENLKSLTAFAIVNFGQMVLDNYHIVSKYTKNQFNCMLQLIFSFIDQLFCDSHVNKQLIEFQQKMMHQLMEFYMDLHKQFKGEENLQTVILKFIIESLILAGGENRIINAQNRCIVMSLNDFPRVKDMLIDTIQNVSSRVKGNELVIQEQFQLLFNLFMKDFNSLLSDAGVEFLINFGTSKDAVVSQCIRKLYYTYKQRDRIYDQKKSIFYQFVLKIIYAIYQSSDTKIYKLLELVPGDVEKERLHFGLDELKLPISQQTYQKLVFIQQFLKTFQNSIMLLLINPKTLNNANSSTGLTKQQDELAYFKMVEGVIRLSLQNKPNNLPLLMTIKYLMHKNFLQAKQQDGTLKGLKQYVSSNRDTLGITNDEMELIDRIISLIDDKIKQKPGLANKKSANTTIVNNGQGSGSKSKSDINMNQDVSKNDEQLIEEEQKNDKDDQPTKEQIEKFNKEATEAKKLIGKKRQSNKRSASRHKNKRQQQDESDEEEENHEKQGKKGRGKSEVSNARPKQTSQNINKQKKIR